MGAFSYKIFKNYGSGDDVLLAIADKELLGKTFKGKEFDISISKDFFHEDSCDGEKALELIKKATVVNAFGKNIINLMLKNNIVKKELVLNPCKVPHAQVVNAV